MEYAKTGRPLSAEGMDRVCDMLGVGEPEVWSVLTVETRGFGYLSDRRPQILFERHIFSRETDRAFDDGFPEVSSRHAGGYKGGNDEYARLAEAARLDSAAAHRSASWGLPQVMGFNHGVVGFGDVHEMVDAVVEGEDEQIKMLAEFILANAKCRIGLQRRDWATFAAAYNGPDFRKNDYDNRLAAAFEKARRMLPDIGLRSVQAALIYIGIDPGPVDGLRGRRTRSALTDFQLSRNLAPTGEVDEETQELLFQAAFGA